VPFILTVSVLADSNSLQKRGSSLFWLADAESQIRSAPPKSLFDALVAAGADLNYKSKPLGVDHLVFHCVRNGARHVAGWLVREAATDVKALSDNSATLLMEVCALGFSEIAVYLITERKAPTSAIMTKVVLVTSIPLTLRLCSLSSVRFSVWAGSVEGILGARLGLLGRVFSRSFRAPQGRLCCRKRPTQGDFLPLLSSLVSPAPVCCLLMLRKTRAACFTWPRFPSSLPL
jgi:hypothetical protein